MRLWITVVVFLIGGFLLFGGELDVKGDFKTLKNNFPDGWRHNTTWGGYQPLAESRMTEEKGRNILHIFNAKGKYGFGILSSSRFPAKSGDKILISAQVRGRGEMAFHLQYYGEKEWLGADSQKSFLKLTNQWQTHTFELTVRNLPKGATKNAILVFSGAKDSELFITNIKAFLQQGEYAGDVRFPDKWRLFGPLPAEFQPSSGDLKAGVPERLNGITGKDVLLHNGMLDFLQVFGEQKAHICGWAFAEIEAPYDCSYTIGAGADWWMQFFVNGISMIDTLDSGNGKHPPKSDDYTISVRLKKGRNLLAVKFISGGGSSLLALGGGRELGSSRKAFRILTAYQTDDYDVPKERSGNPRLAQGYPTVGLYTLTGQGVYTASPKMVLAESVRNYSLPDGTGNEYLAMGIRIQSFGEKPEDSELFFETEKESGLKVIFRKGDNNLTLSLISGGEEKNREFFPCSLLPADFTFAQKENETLVSVKSLVDSSIHNLKSANTPAGKETTMKLSLQASGKTAQIVVDDFFIAQVIPQDKSAIPYKSELTETFDPAKNGWKLVFQDEFDGEEIDWRDKWYIPAWSKDRTKDYAKLDGNGNLHIFAAKNPSTGKIHTSMLWSRKSFLYGYFEARLRFTKAPGWNAAFWCIGSGSNPMTAGGYEIDIFEDYYTRPRFGRPAVGVLDHNLHASLGPRILKSFNRNSCLPATLDDFYVIAAKWTPFEVSYYLNGKLLRNTSGETVSFNAFDNAFCMAPVKAILSAIIRKGTEEPPPEDFIVDYIRVWQEPEEEKPVATWKSFPGKGIITAGEKIRLGVSAAVSEKTRSPITCAYLFDNGYLIDYRTEKPYEFELAIDPVHYNGTAYMKTGRQRKKPELDGYPHFYSIAVQDAAGKVGAAPVRPVIVRMGEHAPYQNIPRSIPGKIQAGDFDDGGLNAAFYSAKEVSRTAPLRLADGNWATYTLNVSKTAGYDLEFRYSSGRETEAPPSLLLYVDGRLVGEGAFSLENPNFRLKNLRLTEGRHIFTFLLKGNPAISFQSFEFRETAKK